MNTILCLSCNTQLDLKIELVIPKQFVCSSCGQLHEFVDNKLQILNHKYPIKKCFVNIGESILLKKKKYIVLGYCVKRSLSNAYTWTEIVLIDNLNKLQFLAQGKDYNASLVEVSPISFNNKLNYIKFAGFNYKNDKYIFDSNLYAEVIQAEGIFFTDLREKVNTYTFFEEYFEKKFISIEEYESKTEYFTGVYMSSNEFNNLFQNKRDQLNIQKQNRNSIIKIAAFFLLLCTLTFLGLNFNNFKKQTSKFILDHKNVKENVIISNSFTLQGFTRNFNIKGVSYISNVINSPSVKLHLVNEETNLRDYTSYIKFFDNKLNKANSFDITFCQVQQGNYHFEYVLENIDKKLSPNSDTPYSNIDFISDYKITWGNEINYAYFIGLIILTISWVIYQIVKQNNQSAYSLQIFVKRDLLFNNKAEILKTLVLFYLLFFGIKVYLINYKDCKTQAKVSSIENANYTGSRSHYIYRTYTSGGSHK